jgi:nucleotide-binding universal stress UspA family protein
MVPLDGSPFSEQVVPLAIAVARQVGATLHLVHVPEPVTGEERPKEGEGNEYPAEVARRIAEETDVGTHAIRLVGKPLDQLVGYLDREGIELVVIATHGWGGLTRVRLGSITESLVRRLRIPILTIRPAEEGEEGGGGAGPGESRAVAGEVPPRGIPQYKPLEHIVVPLDGSSLAESVLSHAAAVGGPDARISLIQVIPAPVPNDPASVSLVLTVDQATIDAERTRGLAYLDRVAERPARQVRRVDTAVILEPQPVASILDFADQNEVDLIAIATHGRGGLRRLTLGSVTDKILRTANVPVLVFRPGEP